ncbi:transmembrane protein 185B isoform X2 [Sitodiplosis mosellana]|uniref:transmembrane protein 185B isoform X2 n=1 Tax=Sitodiplosis mosellana TaxID=263140 RepID=UPI0024446E9E|nr:transmembrane protein 185B isoform X2 [Sitodiplosis mosellana]
MDLQTLFLNFNPSKFVVHSCLFVFAILFTLRIDDWPYWAVFMPIWIWKSIVALGAVFGTFVWLRHPNYRIEGDSYIHYKAMLISFSLHLILLMFELLACDRLTSHRPLWVIVFFPLVFGSVASVGACVWSVKHDRSFELELFMAVNALQFVFLPLKLDELVTWSWEVVFVPLWIVLCLSLVGVLYSVIFCGILLRTPEVSQSQRRTAINSAIGNSLTVIPILVYQVLLADKLDGDLKSLPFTVISIPLFMGLFALILLSFNSKGGNKWWFGIRKSFSQFLLNAMPCLQEYGNIGYHSTRNQNVPLDSTTQLDDVEANRRSKSKDILNKKCDQMKPVVPIINIDLPD